MWAKYAMVTHSWIVLGVYFARALFNAPCFMRKNSLGHWCLVGASLVVQLALYLNWITLNGLGTIASLTSILQIINSSAESTDRFQWNVGMAVLWMLYGRLQGDTTITYANALCVMIGIVRIFGQKLYLSQKHRNYHRDPATIIPLFSIRPNYRR